jgi:hypothetical protein
MMRSTRHGFALAELLVSLVIAGIIGISLTKLIVNQARFVATQQGMMTARAGARAGFNVMVQELRMVTRGGVIAPTTKDSITVLVPYAFGIACVQPAGGSQAVALFPVDSAAYASAALRGYAWRDSTGTWKFKEPATIMPGVVTDCTTALPGVTVLTNGQIVRVSPNIVTIEQGSPMYLYQRVRYALAPSVQLPGRTALWRTMIDLNQRDELVAPFDTNSTFSFLTGNGLTVQSAVPAVLDSLRGVRVRLVGQSEDPPEGRTTPSRFDLSMDIAFVNRAP